MGHLARLAGRRAALVLYSRGAQGGYQAGSWKLRLQLQAAYYASCIELEAEAGAEKIKLRATF